MQQPQIPLQQFQAPRPSGGAKASLLYGLIFGGGVGLIDIIYSYLLDNGNISWFYGLITPLYRLPYVLDVAISGAIVSLPIYILLFIGFLLAGLLAARKSRRVVSGTLAGLLAGGVFLVIDLFIASILLTILLIFPQIAHDMAGAADLSSAESSTMVSAVAYSVVAGLILIGLGALIGSLGGLLGKGSSTDNAPAQSYLLVPANPYQAQPPGYTDPQPNSYGQSALPNQSSQSPQD